MFSPSIVWERLNRLSTETGEVQYQDPSSGEIGEFEPSQSPQRPSRPTGMPETRAELDRYFVGKGPVTVRAESFDAGHYRYPDPNGHGQAEFWLSDQVPGYLVKSIYTNAKDGKVMRGELVAIESGVGTSLGSY